MRDVLRAKEKEREREGIREGFIKGNFSDMIASVDWRLHLSSLLRFAFIRKITHTHRVS
jgi:ribulose-5-phosphate 4-epimerase/fuculose-1-phosphate aldolase